METTDTAYPLLEGAAGNGWCALAAGTYDITFDQTNSTIKFSLSENQGEIEEGDVWYLTGAFNNWTLAAKFTQTDDNPNEFELNNFNIPESATAEGYWQFVITTPEWANQYICDENVDNLENKYSFVARHDNVTAYSHLPAGNYDFVWNKTDHTLTVKSVTNTSIIDSVVSEEAETQPVFYNLNGAQVNGKNLEKGIYVKVTGKKIEKVKI